MTQIILSTALISFEGRPKDMAETIADACLYLPRKIFGSSYQSDFQEISIDRITRIATAIIFVLGIALTLPLAVIGIIAASASKTYNASLAHYHLQSPTLHLAQDHTLQEIFRHAVVSIDPASFPKCLVRALKKNDFTHTIGKNLMLAIDDVTSIAQASADVVDPNSDGISAPELILHCHSVDQFQQFIKAIEGNDAKMELSLGMLLNFFYDKRNLEMFNLRGAQFSCLAALCSTQDKLVGWIQKSLSTTSETREQQLARIKELLPNLHQRVVAENPSVS